MPLRDTEHAAFIRINFGTVWPVHLVAFIRLLVQLRSRFYGDLDLALVLAVIGSRTQVENWKSELSELGELTNRNEVEDKQLPINIHSVAEYTGIPRETVRRKVVTLQKKDG